MPDLNDYTSLQDFPEKTECCQFIRIIMAISDDNYYPHKHFERAFPGS
jgi:hypothetical protein